MRAGKYAVPEADELYPWTVLIRDNPQWERKQYIGKNLHTGEELDPAPSHTDAVAKILVARANAKAAA